MKQRTELEYDWLNECIAVKELRDSGMDLKVLAGIMNKRKGDIEDSINALTEADLYLSEWRNTPFDYEAIDDAKQLFYDMGRESEPEVRRSPRGEPQNCMGAGGSPPRSRPSRL